jgi:hypothetical protein
LTSAYDDRSIGAGAASVGPQERALADAPRRKQQDMMVLEQSIQVGQFGEAAKEVFPLCGVADDDLHDALRSANLLCNDTVVQHVCCASSRSRTGPRASQD